VPIRRSPPCGELRPGIVTDARLPPGLLALTRRLSYTSGAQQTAPVLSPLGSLCLVQLGYGKPTAPGIAEDGCRLLYSRYHLPLVQREHHSMDQSLWHRRATHRQPTQKVAARERNTAMVISALTVTFSDLVLQILPERLPPASSVAPFEVGALASWETYCLA
jgi:hypothetical protein